MIKHIYFFLLIVFINVFRLGLGLYLNIPEVALILIFIYASATNRVYGSIMGVTIGLIKDIMIGRAIGIYAITYLLPVYLVGYLMEHKFVSSNRLNMFLVFALGSGLFEMIFWLLNELTFMTEVSILSIFKWQQIINMIIQSVIGVLLYPRLRKIVKKGGYLFKY
ncbi:rod shape-determining protein MreD [Natranaerobius trueperi]|nr:rod shape-determining protein MreD [Natranaerobius trueperi]